VQHLNHGIFEAKRIKADIGNHGGLWANIQGDTTVNLKHILEQIPGFSMFDLVNFILSPASA